MGTANGAVASPPEKKTKKEKDRNQTPESRLHHSLQECFRSSDVGGALALYDAAAAKNAGLSSYHFNTLLHICSTAAERPSGVVEHAFRVFDHMMSSGIRPTEATITSMARIAASDGAGCGKDKAFEMVREMEARYGLLPKLRTYGPALFAYCERPEDADKAYAVEEHMVAMGVSPEERELAALLKVSSGAGRGGKVYEYLHKLRRCLSCVQPSTAEIIEHWFESENAAEIGTEKWDVVKVKEAILMNGGGWHGEGWLGKGEWTVRGSHISSEGRCDCCGEVLTGVDIGQVETERFAESIASLAMEREAIANFGEFQEWLEDHADYKAILDGANIALYQQNFADGGFSVSQIESVVRELSNKSQENRPLVVIHNKRLKALMESPDNRQLLEDWHSQGSLYATPHGSNDDWYWLYAAVKLGCLLVTNDEMRDHIFELLGNKLFPRWKERHQVRYSFLKDQVKLEMPPSYSTLIQESEQGSWHIPLNEKCEDEKSRKWLCIARASSCETASKSDHMVEPIESSTKMHKTDDNRADNGHSLERCSSGVRSPPPATLGKRKDRSPCPLPQPP